MADRDYCSDWSEDEPGWIIEENKKAEAGEAPVRSGPLASGRGGRGMSTKVGVMILVSLVGLILGLIIGACIKHC